MSSLISIITRFFIALSLFSFQLSVTMNTASTYASSSQTPKINDAVLSAQEWVTGKRDANWRPAAFFSSKDTYKKNRDYFLEHYYGDLAISNGVERVINHKANVISVMNDPHTTISNLVDDPQNKNKLFILDLYGVPNDQEQAWVNVWAESFLKKDICIFLIAPKSVYEYAAQKTEEQKNLYKELAFIKRIAPAPNKPRKQIVEINDGIPIPQISPKWSNILEIKAKNISNVEDLMDKELSRLTPSTPFMVLINTIGLTEKKLKEWFGEYQHLTVPENVHIRFLVKPDAKKLLEKFYNQEATVFPKMLLKLRYWVNDSSDNSFIKEDRVQLAQYTKEQEEKYEEYKKHTEVPSSYIKGMKAIIEGPNKNVVLFEPGKKVDFKKKGKRKILFVDCGQKNPQKIFKKLISSEAEFPTNWMVAVVGPMPEDYKSSKKNKEHQL